MGNWTGNADNKFTTTSKNGKTEKRLEYVEKKRKKATQVKQKIQLEEINQKVLVKEGRLKRYCDGI